MFKQGIIFISPITTCMKRLEDKEGSDLYLEHVDNATDAVALLHGVESLVDILQRLAVGNELVDLELAGLVIGYEVWELRAALDATESATLPDTTGDELECCDKLAVGHADGWEYGATYVGWRSPVQQQQHQSRYSDPNPCGKPPKRHA
jgi:hypothetical protein